MAQLVFEKKINLTTSAKNSEPKYVDKLIVGNDPDNDIFQYYISNRHFNDKSSQIENANYDIQWSNPTASVTAKLTKGFGVKGFPTVGSVGFYTPVVGNSKILVPIHVKPEPNKSAPLFTITQGTSTIAYTIVAPSDVSYECYRIILSGSTEDIEYVTYDTTGEVPLPTVSGTYEMYCIGYTAEGDQVSSHSVSYTIVVSGASTAAPTGYYSKAEVDAMIQRLEGLIK